MSDKAIHARIYRFGPSIESEPAYQSYDVPFEEGMSAMDVLDYIYQNVDGSLAYYDHAGCALGICGKCSGRINGKPGLFCQTPVKEGELMLEPLNTSNVLVDLVMGKA